MQPELTVAVEKCVNCRCLRVALIKSLVVPVSHRVVKCSCLTLEPGLSWKRSLPIPVQYGALICHLIR